MQIINQLKCCDESTAQMGTEIQRLSKHFLKILCNKHKLISVPMLAFHNKARDRSRKGTILVSSLPRTINNMQIILLQKVNSNEGLI